MENWSHGAIIVAWKNLQGPVIVMCVKPVCLSVTIIVCGKCHIYK